MKSASSQLVQQIKTGTAPSALPEVTVDWNLNRYHDTRVDNTPNEQDAGFDIELFPIESIVEPNRPSKGINKARVNQSVVSGTYLSSIKGPTSRYYVADPDDKYKYWTSPLPAVGGVIPVFSAANFPADDYDLTGFDNKTSARPAVEYGTWSANKKTFTPKTVKANKIVIKLENSWSSPNDFDIVITRASNTVTISGSNITGWEASGEIVLRWNGTSWAPGGTRLDGPDDFPLTDEIKKIQLVVRTLKGGYQKDGSPTKYQGLFGYTNTTNGQDGFLDVIAIEAHLEARLTPWLIDVEETFEMSEVSNLYPIGTVTSNQGTMTLSNIYIDSQGNERTGLFSRDNTSIIWHDYMEPNAEVNLEYVYRGGNGELGRVKQFVMYSEVWAGQSGDTVSVELADYAKFFNDITVPPAMWEGLTVPAIIWRVLDSVGFSNYEIDLGDKVTEHTIPVFYTNGEDSVLTVLDDLAKASQSAVYFDGRGVLNIKTRDYAFSDSSSPVWKFQSNDTAEQLSNIISLDQNIDFEPNSFKVIYQKTNWSDFNRSQPSMQRVWEPENDSVVLRGTPLVRNLGSGDYFVWIDPKEAKLWPFQAVVNIQGELIRIDGKQMVYFVGPNKTADRRTATVRSSDEVKAINNKKAASGMAKHSHFTGGLRIAVDDNGDFERGVWNSEERTHLVNASGYSVRHRVSGVSRSGVHGFAHLKKKSKVQMSNGGRFKNYGDILIATRGSVNDLAFLHYGTKFNFVKEQGRTTQCAGIVIHNSGSTEDGYYFELTPSKKIGGKRRKQRGELIVYSRVNGVDKRLGRADLAISEGIEYELDVSFINLPNSPNHRLQAWVNGKLCVTANVSGATRNGGNGKFGLFTRGLTKAEFEYLYAVRREVSTPPDDFSFLDKVRRGYVGARWDREWVYRWKSVRRRTKKGWRRAKRRFNRQFFDDFGPIVHEVREFDVKFEPSPVLHSRLYMTNDWSAVNIEYNATPFGAKFIVANTARHNAVIHGDDSLSYAGDGQVVNQVLTVLGRGLVIADDEEVLAENSDQIRRRGKIESEISSPWIQSKAMATDLAKWLRKNFSYGNENVTLEVFGNPLIEVGDVISIDYPEVHVSGDYFVMAVNNSFDTGLNTTITARKRI